MKVQHPHVVPLEALIRAVANLQTWGLATQFHGSGGETTRLAEVGYGDYINRNDVFELLDGLSRPCPPPPAEAHCTTCSCVPGMTPAVRFDTTPAEKEGAVRDHLIRMGWTPPMSSDPIEAPGSDFDVMRDVYMTKAQREAFDRIRAAATAPVGVEAEPSPVRALVEAANAVLAENPPTDDMWRALEQAVRPFNATEPAECADGCPPQQVCDYCQIASFAHDCNKGSDDLQLDAAMSTAAIAWGLLGQMLDEDLKRYGIQAAKAEGAQVNVPEADDEQFRKGWQAGFAEIEALRASKGATYIKYELLHAELAKSKAQAKRLAEALVALEAWIVDYVPDDVGGRDAELAALRTALRGHDQDQQGGERADE